ncbi:hypothetical protein L0337_34890 [candidate division KSB1 bacterium]|nr:hypothetical protein [candidate division KSB1 bacterium]
MKSIKYLLSGILLVVPILVHVLLFAQAERTKPEKVHYYAQKMMPREWYAQQAELWKIEAGKDSKNGEAWRNYYLATEYANRDGDPAASGAKLAQILNDMQAAIMGNALPDSYKYLAAEKQESRLQKAFFSEAGPTSLAKSIPGLYEFLILKYRHDDGNIAMLEGAYQLRPDDPQTYDDLIVHYETMGNEAKAKEFCERLYQSQYLATGLLEYNYNVLMSTEKNALLFTNGDNDTFPIWLLQRAKGIRPDVTVLNVHMIGEQNYLKRLLKTKNVEVDLEKLPDKDVYRCIPELGKAIAAANPAVPVYFALTLEGAHTKGLANNLYVTGLASRYSSKRIDNLAMLRENVEANFRLDYLKFDWYSENHVSTPSIGETLNTNYVAPFMMLAEHCEKIGEHKKAEYWKNFALDIARAAGDQALIEHLKNRKPAMQ